MMTKTDHITYWKTIAEKDIIAVEHLFEKGDYVHSLFFAHLLLEKLLKAHFVKDNPTNFPPKIHNLTRLEALTNLGLAQSEIVFLERMTDFQLEGRYPDYTLNLYQRCTQSYTKVILDEVQSLANLLLNRLP